MQVGADLAHASADLRAQSSQQMLQMLARCKGAKRCGQQMNQILFEAILNDIYVFLFSFNDKRSGLDRR